MSNIIPVTDFSAPELDVYARLSETQLLHYYEPKEGIFIAESPKVIERALDQGYTPVSMLVEDKHIAGQAGQVIGQALRDLVQIGLRIEVHILGKSTV